MTLFRSFLNHTLDSIKVDRRTGRLYLLDFGASYLKGPYSLKAEKIEVRAYGILVDELTTLLDSKEGELRSKLNKLSLECSNPIVNARPTFSDIRSKLDVIFI